MFQMILVGLGIKFDKIAYKNKKDYGWMIEDGMLFSIIVAAYNVQDYIDDCIASCEHQDIDRSYYEIIVINDGSTDGTLDRVKELKRRYSNIKLLCQPNQGQSVARNIGVKETSGKYIWFVDSDDRISKNCLGRIYKIMEENNLDAFSVVGDKFLEEVNNDTDMSLRPVVKGVTYLIDNAPTVAAPWGYVFKRQFWQERGFSFISGIYYEDYQLIPIVLSQCSKITTFVDRISCYDYISRPSSTMNSPLNARKINGYISIVNTHMQYSKEVDSEALRNYFEVSSSYCFIACIKKILWCTKDMRSQLNRFLEGIDERPKRVYAGTFLGKVKQYVELRFPIVYCAMVRALIFLLGRGKTHK